MNVDDYAAWAARVARAQAADPPDRERLSYLGLGLASEAGEVVDHIKKLLRDGDSAWRPDQVAEELGDLAYYWAALCVAAGRNPSEILAASQAKIEERIKLLPRSPAPPSG
ncbi:MAG: nucleoside triphosphate pyrophosphohydrolase family protein [Elsteraceae bacterium]